MYVAHSSKLSCSLSHCYESQGDREQRAWGDGVLRALKL